MRYYWLWPPPGCLVVVAQTFECGRRLNTQSTIVVFNALRAGPCTFEIRIGKERIPMIKESMDGGTFERLRHLQFLAPLCRIAVIKLNQLVENVIDF